MYISSSKGGFQGEFTGILILSVFCFLFLFLILICIKQRRAKRVILAPQPVYNQQQLAYEQSDLPVGYGGYGGYGATMV